jgi:UDP-N-acetylmuramoyl-tripeptide--D-alanyl-D-alanine ligase
MKKISKKLAQYYLWLLAKITLWRYRPSIIAVTGSTWRHSVKEATFQILHDQFKIRMSPKNYNAEIGVPLSILGLSAESSSKLNWLRLLLFEAVKRALFDKNFPEKLILELAIDRPRDIDYLTTLIKPEIIVITNITSEYLDNFGSLDNIATEYAKLIKVVPKEGLIILNYDDLRLRELIKIHPHAITYGLNKDAQIHPDDLQQTPLSQTFKLKINDEVASFQLNKFGVHHLYAVLIAQAIKNYYRKIE